MHAGSPAIRVLLLFDLLFFGLNKNGGSPDGLPSGSGACVQASGAMEHARQHMRNGQVLYHARKAIARPRSVNAAARVPLPQETGPKRAAARPIAIAAFCP
jgi:hypothetical protein